MTLLRRPPELVVADGAPELWGLLDAKFNAQNLGVVPHRLIICKPDNPSGLRAGWLAATNGRLTDSDRYSVYAPAIVLMRLAQAIRDPHGADG